MTTPAVISLARALKQLRYVGDRHPESTDADLEGAFAELAPYRDGGIFIGHYAGNSEWERHSRGDEIVYVLDGETTLFLLNQDGNESSHRLGAGSLLVVPQNTWHRFETPNGVQIMTVTPQPTDHSTGHPQA